MEVHCWISKQIASIFTKQKRVCSVSYSIHYTEMKIQQFIKKVMQVLIHHEKRLDEVMTAVSVFVQ